MYLKMDQSDSKENNIKIHYTFLYFTLFKIPMCVSRPAHRLIYYSVKTLLILEKNQKIYANLTHFVGEPTIGTKVVFSNNKLHFKLFHNVVFCNEFTSYLKIKQENNEHNLQSSSVFKFK